MADLAHNVASTCRPEWKVPRRACREGIAFTSLWKIDVRKIDIHGRNCKANKGCAKRVVEMFSIKCEHVVCPEALAASNLRDSEEDGVEGKSDESR